VALEGVDGARARLAERDVRREPREGHLREEGRNVIPTRKLGRQGSTSPADDSMAH
jgi:hypothetical protein